MTIEAKIKQQFNEDQIFVGDEISQQYRVDLMRAIAGDSPEKIERFYRAWYKVTDDGPGFGTHPNLPKRTK